MRRIALRRIVLPLVLAAAACADPSGPDVGSRAALERATDGVRLEVARTEYRHGEAAQAVLSNTSSEQVGYNTCTTARERWDGSRWVRIEPLRLCLGVIYTLEPGQRVTYEEPITEEWTPGRYRLLLPALLLRDGRPLDVRSEPFVVVAG